MNTRIVLIGAGSATFGLGMLGDIFKSQVLEGSTVVLHDINPQALQKVEGIAQQYVQEHNLSYPITATTSRQEALQGADFCVISIEVGQRFELWEQDWRIPQQYGNRQVYGENGGPGGLFHALRIIPPILDICDDIHKICPQATVFNLSNPMTRICMAVKRKYPALRVIGLCHEINELIKILPGILNVPFSELKTTSAGLNHFTVLLEVSYKATGQDAYPDVRKKAAAYLEKLPEMSDILRYKHQQTDARPEFKGRTWSDRGLIKEILEKFGYLPVTVDSHFGEYIQWAHDVVDHKSILDFYNWYKDWSFTHSPVIPPHKTSERVVPIMEGMLTDSQQAELAVNIPNDGLIENLPQNVVVEVPAVVNKTGVHGVQLGTLPKGIVGLWNNQVAVLDLTVEAVLKGSRELALQALFVDPTVDSVKHTQQMFDVMLELQQKYLGYLK